MDFGKIDRIIDGFCDCINHELDAGSNTELPEMISALSELITARADAITFKYNN